MSTQPKNTSCRRLPPSRRRPSSRRRGVFLSFCVPSLFDVLGVVLLFASSVVMFVALIAAATLDVWAGAFGGLLSVVTALVGYGLTARWLP